MKLNYNSKRTITTADMYDACNPPLIFEVRTHPDKEWVAARIAFGESNDEDVELAKQVIAFAFLTVSDGGEVYSIRTVAQVEDLRQAIEDENPGYGDEFLLAIAWGFISNHFNYLSEHLGNSLRPLSQSNGNGLESQKVKVS